MGDPLYTTQTTAMLRRSVAPLGALAVVALVVMAIGVLNYEDAASVPEVELEGRSRDPQFDFIETLMREGKYPQDEINAETKAPSEELSQQIYSSASYAKYAKDEKNLGKFSRRRAAADNASVQDQFDKMFKHYWEDKPKPKPKPKPAYTGAKPVAKAPPVDT